MAVNALESSIDLAPERRGRVLWRLDGGFGSDANLRFVLERGYHLLAKGYSGRRAWALARQVRRWDSCGDVEVGWVAAPVAWCARPVQVVVRRRWQGGSYHHNYFVSSVRFASKGALLRAYQGRGAAEIEQFRGDKQALALAQRRKGRLMAQQALLALVDLAHNLLSHFARHALAEGALAGFGPTRTVRDLFAIPGARVGTGRQQRVHLEQAHLQAAAMATALRRYQRCQLPPLDASC